MRLDLTRAFVTDGFSQSVDYTADFSSYAEEWGLEMITEPAKVTGRLYNKAGVLYIELSAKYVLHGECDRCCSPVDTERTAHLEFILVKEKQDEASDGLLQVEGETLETDDLVAEALLLDIPSKVLCKEDCKGLCSMCGQNLNLKKCDCKKQQSPFDILKQEFNR